MDMKDVKDYVRNPLGIIALFISLIYGFANLLMGMSAEKLTPEERCPLIWFIIVFPVMVLIAFYRLVTKHHGKLYAPSDYKDDKSFLRTLSREEKETKLNDEVRESFDQTSDSEGDATRKQKNHDKNDVDKREWAENRKREYQKQRADLENVETVVIDGIGKEYGIKPLRNVGIEGINAKFDAYLESDRDISTFIEVKALRSVTPMVSMLDRLLYNTLLADRFFDSKFKLILVIVCYFDIDKLKSSERIWRRKINDCPANIELRFVERSEINASPIE